MTVTESVRRAGGIVRLRTLRHHGWSERAVRRAVDARELVRPRKGWVALPGADPLLLSATRAGVVISCVTRAQRMGLWVLDASDRPHVAAPPCSSTVHIGTDAATGEPKAVVHWAQPIVPRHPDAVEDTIENNIMKVIGPMFLDELRQRFTDGYHDTAKLKKLRADMSRMRFLDPACGCGNFLVVGYRQMRALDLEVLLRIQELSGETARTMFFTEEHLAVKLSSFHGIELEEWPAQIAATALHLVEHQANQAMELALGAAPDSLPLDKIKSIVVGNALRIDWADVVEPSADLYVMGNPPFIGHKTKATAQRDDLRVVWGAQFDGYLDYVTGWFKKAADFLGDRGGHFAFVSTNSIVQGQPVPALFRPLIDAGWRVAFAHRTFAWTSEAPSADGGGSDDEGIAPRERSEHDQREPVADRSRADAGA